MAVQDYLLLEAVLACYSGTGFDEALRAEARCDRVLLVDVAQLYR